MSPGSARYGSPALVLFGEYARPTVALRLGAVVGLLDEDAKLAIRDLMAIQPKGTHADPVGGAFEGKSLIRSHEKGAGGDSNHLLGRRWWLGSTGGEQQAEKTTCEKE
jgi:hypothetical protein